MADFVLVHGTTQAPSGWARLVEELEQRGHRTCTVDLATDTPEPTVADLARLASRQCGSSVTEPVVVAHSGSGLVLPEIAQMLGAAHQVWLAATVPDPAGERSLADEVRSDPETMFNSEWIGVDPTVDSVAAAYFLFHDSDLATLRWALGTLRAFSAITAAYNEVPPPRPADNRPSTYILPQDDRTMRPGHMRRLAQDRLHIEPIEIPGGHCPHVAQPARLAKLFDTKVR